MAFTFEQLFAADPSNPSNIAQNASIVIFAPGDPTMAPLTITDPDGTALPNPFSVNANGFGPAFMHETLDRVAWIGGGFTGFVTSYEGLKQVALDAQAAAETAATTAGVEAAAVATAAIGDATSDAEAAAASAATAASSASASATASANSAALVGAPADTAVETLINSASATKAALNSTFVPKWKATTAYLAGDAVLSPAGDTVTAKANFTSGASYNAANWNYARLNDYFVNVKAFGAKADGATNDTAAIHAARDYAFTNGYVVYLPPSPTPYRTDALIANKANQTWVIAPGATIQPVTATATSILQVTAANVTLTGGGTLDGSTTTNPSSAGIYSFSAAHSDLTIDNLKILNTGGYGIQAAGSRTKIRNCTINNSFATAINIGPVTADISDCEIIGNMVDRTNAGPSTTFGNIFVAGTSGGLKIRRTKIHHNTVIMPLSPTAAAGNMIGIETHRGSIGTSIVGNHTYNGCMGISIAALSLGATATGNVIFGPNWYGIEVAESSYCTVSGNTIDGNGVLGTGASSSTYGIVLNISGANSNYNVISGNTITGIAAGATNSSAGISIAGGTGTGNVISNNTMTVSVHGIATVSENVEITGNRVTGAGNTIGNAVRFSGTLGKAVVAGNFFENFLTGVDITRVGGVIDSIAVTGNTFLNVATPKNHALSGGATIGSNVRWTGNVGAGVVNTANSPADPGARFVTNYYYGPQAGSLGTAAPPLNTLHAYPLPVAAAGGLTIQQISVGVSVAQAGATYRVGVYSDANGVPGNLIEEFTAATPLDASTTGDKTLAVALRNLPTGLYWVAAVAQGTTAATVGILTGAGPYIGRTAASSATGHAMAYTVSGVTGALPASFGTPGGTNYAITALLRAA